MEAPSVAAAFASASQLLATGSRSYFGFGGLLGDGTDGAPPGSAGALFCFYFIPWKPADTRPRGRCGRAQLVLLPSLTDLLPHGRVVETTEYAARQMKILLV